MKYATLVVLALGTLPVAFAVGACDVAGLGGNTTDDGDAQAAGDASGAQDAPYTLSDTGTRQDTGTTSGQDAAVADAAGNDAAATDGAGDAGDGATQEGGNTTDAAIPCPTQPCTGGSVCCASPHDGGVDMQCAATCGTGDALQCSGPSDCGGGTCCGSIVLGGGVVLACNVSSVSSACASSCTEAAQATCSGTDTVHLCQSKADCASDPDFNTDCCTYPQSPLPFCVSPTLVASVAPINCKN